MVDSKSIEFHQQVCKKLNTSPQQIKKDLEVLKEWKRQQPHLPQTSSDVLLTNFLIANKNSMELAKVKIENFYSARLMFPDFFANRDPEDEKFQEVYNEVRLFKLPKFTPDGFRVTMSFLATGDPDKYNLSNTYRRLLSYKEINLNTDMFCSGDIIIFDAKLCTMSHALKMTPTVIRDFMYCIQNAYPINVKGIIAFNSPPLIELIVNVAKPFMSKKIFERVHIHSEGPEILDKYLPLKMLPSDYGGEEESSEQLHEAWKQILKEKRDWLMKEGTVTVDEKKRIGGNKNRNGFENDEIQGSFKTLCID